MYNDSRIPLHKHCQIPRNCQCKCLSAFPTARDPSVDSLLSPDKFWFHMDKIESRAWPI